MTKMKVAFALSFEQLLSMAIQPLLTIILLGVLPDFSIYAQVNPIDKSSKSNKEKAILKNYSTISFADKVKANEQILELWFDSNKYSRITLSNNLDLDQPVSGVYQSAGLLYSKINNRVIDKVVFFDQKSGKVSKVLDVSKINPYSKARLPQLQMDLQYDGERFRRAEKLNGKADRSLITKYFSWTAGGWHGDHFLIVYRKYGLQDTYRIIDEWNTHTIYDQKGSLIFNSGEVNYHAFSYRLREDGKYYIVEINDGDSNVDSQGNTWQTQGFVVFDVKNGKEVYRYFLPKDETNKAQLGAYFDVTPSELIVGSNSFPNEESGKTEKILIDLKNKLDYRYVFSKSMMDQLSKDWDTKYKTYSSLLNFFPFEKRTIE